MKLQLVRVRLKSTLLYNNASRYQSIYTNNVSIYTSFKNVLIQLKFTNGFSCNATSSHLIVQPNGLGSAKLTLDHLKSSDTDFHTFRVVIRNLRHSTVISVTVTNALTELDHSVRYVVNIKKNKLLLPLLFVDLNTKSNYSDNFNIPKYCC